MRTIKLSHGRHSVGNGPYGGPWPLEYLEVSLWFGPLVLWLEWPTLLQRTLVMIKILSKDILIIDLIGIAINIVIMLDGWNWYNAVAILCFALSASLLIFITYRRAFCKDE